MRRKLNFKTVALALGISGIVVWGASIPFTKILNKNHIKNDENISISAEAEENKKEEEKIVNYVGTNEEGKKYTYDDGTSKTNTPEVLRILDENNVKATFFLTGSNIENGGETAKELIKEEFNRGHAIANHGYSHDFKKLYPGRYLDIDAFKADFEKNEELLKSVLGENFSTKVIRCPGGYMSWKGMEPLDKYLEENDMVSIDWNALNADAEGPKKNAQELTDYAIKTAEGKEMVVMLMHDTYGKEETVKALPAIIKYFKDNGYEFRTLV